MGHREGHLAHRGGWLRAAVLGANDGIISTASLVMGVSGAASDHRFVVAAGLAGLIGGALSMAAGEFVSVSSQKDAEEADLAKERAELRDEADRELDELTGLVAAKGVPRELARQVAEAMTAHDALAAHAREELGIDLHDLARPWEAAWSSALSFAVGAAVPLAAIAWAPDGWRVGATGLTTLVALAGLGGLGARLGGAPVLPAVARVVAGGGIAMGLTHLVGRGFGVSGVAG